MQRSTSEGAIDWATLLGPSPRCSSDAKGSVITTGITSSGKHLIIYVRKSAIIGSNICMVFYYNTTTIKKKFAN